RPSARAAPAADVLARLKETLQRLRAEFTAATDPRRRARMLSEVADLEERMGDEPAAARDLLAAFNADGDFREALESLLGLLERRRSLKNLVRVIDALVRTAATGEEKARALLLRSAF